jgi:hypothetical protein
LFSAWLGQNLNSNPTTFVSGDGFWYYDRLLRDRRVSADIFFSKKKKKYIQSWDQREEKCIEILENWPTSSLLTRIDVAKEIVSNLN